MHVDVLVGVCVRVCILFVNVVHIKVRVVCI